MCDLRRYQYNSSRTEKDKMYESFDDKTTKPGEDAAAKSVVGKAWL